MVELVQVSQYPKEQKVEKLKIESLLSFTTTKNYDRYNFDNMPSIYLSAIVTGGTVGTTLGRHVQPNLDRENYLLIDGVKYTYSDIIHYQNYSDYAGNVERFKAKIENNLTVSMLEENL